MAFLRSGFAARASLEELIRTLPGRQLMLLWLAIFSTFTATSLRRRWFAFAALGAVDIMYIVIVKPPLRP